MSLLNNGIEYFLYRNITDTQIKSIYNKKSGKIAELFITLLMEEYCYHINTQYRFKHSIFVICTDNCFIEIKNYMYESTGTANEKLEGGIIKYETYITNNDFCNGIFILCAKFEEIFMNKHITDLLLNGYLNRWFNKGIYITFLTSVINDFLLSRNNNMRYSFIKWAGGKGKLLDKIDARIKKFIQQRQDKKLMYIEPFLGSGSVLIHILTKYSKHFSFYICSDINELLIITFKEIQTNHEKLINLLKIMEKYYLSLDSKDREKTYYDCRELYNKVINNHDKLDEYITEFKRIFKCDLNSITLVINLLISVLFIFINKTCFRGLYRVNKHNIFNVPYGNYKKPSIVNSELITELHKLFTDNNVIFECKSFEKSIIENESDYQYLLYLDPPYYNTFDNYTIDRFNYDDNKFIEYLDKVSREDNYYTILSNSYDFKKKITDNNLPVSVIEEICIDDRMNSKQPNNKRFEILAIFDN